MQIILNATPVSEMLTSLSALSRPGSGSDEGLGSHAGCSRGPRWADDTHSKSVGWWIGDTAVGRQWVPRCAAALQEQQGCGAAASLVPGEVSRVKPSWRKAEGRGRTGSQCTASVN